MEASTSRARAWILVSLSLYHTLLTTSWTRFFGMVAFSYVATNALFAAAYLMCGPGPVGARWCRRRRGVPWRVLLSVQDLRDIGYGQVSPAGCAANLIVTLESLVGLMGFAVATDSSSLACRTDRQDPFHQSAVIAPYRSITAFEFRIANERRTELIELAAQVLFSRLERDGDRSSGASTI